MDKKDILKSVYDDFFGVNALSDKKDNYEIPETEVPKIIMPEKKENISVEDKDKKLKESFELIDNLYIDEKSKEILKKILEYIRKYNENIEKNFILFNMCIL